jgi:hypothetical protein
LVIIETDQTALIMGRIIITRSTEIKSTTIQTRHHAQKVNCWVTAQLIMNDLAEELGRADRKQEFLCLSTLPRLAVRQIQFSFSTGCLFVQ